jgi:hypothetical protein
MFHQMQLTTNSDCLIFIDELKEPLTGFRSRVCRVAIIKQPLKGVVGAVWN